MRLRDVGIMVFRIFSFRYALRTSCFLAIALISGSLHAGSCTSHTSQNFLSRNQAYNACIADLRDTRQDCYSILSSCTDDPDNEVFTWTAKTPAGASIFNKFSYAPPENDCDALEGTTTQAYVPLEQYDGSATPSLDGCGVTINYSTPDQPLTLPDIACNADYSECFIDTEVEYTGKQENSGTMELDGYTPDSINPEPANTNPVYQEDQQQIQNVQECLSDGTCTQETIDYYTKSKSSYVSMEQDGELAVVTQHGGQLTEKTVTEREVTQPDGSKEVTTTEQNAYTQQPTTISTINFNNSTITQTQTSPGEPVTSTTTTTEAYDSAGNKTGESKETTGDGDGVEQGEEASTPGGGTGELEIPEGSSSEDAKDYTDTTETQMERIKQAPIIQAASDVFEVNLSGGSCPDISFNLPLGIGSVGTTVHCDLIDYMNNTLYPVILAAWSILGVMIFLRA